MEEFHSEVFTGLEALTLPVVRWSRFARGGFSATPWPPDGPFGSVLLRLPRSKEALAMALHAGAGVLERGGTVLVYGAKDEGIASATGPMEEVLSEVDTLGVGGRCRVLQGRKMKELEGLRRTLGDWKQRGIPAWEGLPGPWISYPGVFAHGRLDPGTRRLLEVLPGLHPGDRVLDYGCGSGVVGAVALHREPGIELHLLDIDAIALEAARENVPGGITTLGDGLSEVGPASFHHLLSNPPFHRGKDEDPEMLRVFVREAGRVLRPGGGLTFVTQRRIPLDDVLGSSFKDVNLLARDSTFVVWQARGPRGRE